MRRKEDLPQSSGIVESWITFKERLKDFAPGARARIDDGYDVAKTAHRGQSRESGEDYFEHARGATIIALDECRIKDPDIIIGILTHDVAEDSVLLGYYDGIPYSEWRKTADRRARKYFGRKVSEILIAVTTPKVDGVEILTKHEAKQVAYANLRAASHEAVLVKMFDRLHNLRTLGFRAPEDQLRVIEETESVYFRIFERAKEKYPREARYLLAEMRKSIASVRKNLQSNNGSV